PSGPAGPPEAALEPGGWQAPGGGRDVAYEPPLGGPSTIQPGETSAPPGQYATPGSLATPGGAPTVQPGEVGFPFGTPGTVAPALGSSLLGLTPAAPNPLASPRVTGPSPADLDQILNPTPPSPEPADTLRQEQDRLLGPLDATPGELNVPPAIPYGPVY